MPTAFYTGAVLGAAALLLAAWMILVERRWFRLRRIVLSCEDSGLPPLRILHLTDTHFHGRDSAMLEFLREVAAEQDLDLVLMTGDIIDSPRGVESASEAAETLDGRIGTYAVLGGHDYRHVAGARAYVIKLKGWKEKPFEADNPVFKLVSVLQDRGVRLLRDESLRLTAPDGSEFALVGLRDAFLFEPDLEAAWQAVPSQTPVVAIAHSPDVLPRVCNRGARLACFGHTHGGQVRLPLIGPVVTRSRLPRRLAAGAFRSGRTIFVTNAGLGTSAAMPYRLLCRPEAVLIEIKQDPSPEELTRLPEVDLE